MVSFEISSLFTTIPVGDTFHHQLTQLEERMALRAHQVTCILDLCLMANILCAAERIISTKGWKCYGLISVFCGCQYLYVKTSHSDNSGSKDMEEICGWYFLCVGRGTTHHLSSLHPTVQFIMKLERNSSFHYLDTLLTRKGDGGVNHPTLHTWEFTAKLTDWSVSTLYLAPPYICEVGSCILPVPMGYDCGHEVRRGTPGCGSKD